MVIILRSFGGHLDDFGPKTPKGVTLSKHDFALAEFQTRQRRVRQAMDKAGIDLLLVIHPVNINYLIGSRH